MKRRRVHDAARRRGVVAARGARAAIQEIQEIADDRGLGIGHTFFYPGAIGSLRLFSD